MQAAKGGRMSVHTPNRTLLFHGASILFLSLLAGALVAAPGVANPRMALSAHIAALLSGPILISLGLAWPHVYLSAKTARRTAGLLVLSLYLNFGFVLLAALLGTSAATPIAGAGHAGSAWQEMLVTAGFGVAVVALFAAFAGVLVGLARTAPVE
jgi:hydroxylaminobenzene mutase